MALDALKVELARKTEPRYSSDVLELAPASLALALSSSPKQEDLETEQLDKHEKALLSQVVKPQDVAVAFDSIGGLNDAKKALREAITYPMKYPSLYQDGVAREATYTAPSRRAASMPSTRSTSTRFSARPPSPASKISSHSTWAAPLRMSASSPMERPTYRLRPRSTAYQSALQH